MSYSLNSDCYKCEKKEECSDHAIIEGAIYAIHQTGYKRSHKGGGIININCQLLKEIVLKEGK